MTYLRRGIFVFGMIILLNGIAFARPFSVGILQRAEIDQGLTLGGNLGVGGWPGNWVGLGVSAVGEYGFSGEETKDSFSLNNLAAGFSITHNRTAFLGDKYQGEEYVWRWNMYKFGPYAKYEILDPEKSSNILGDWAQLYFSAAAGFKINISSASLDWEDYGKKRYLNRGPYSNTFMVDLLLLADYSLSNVVDDGFLNDVTLTLGMGLANNRFASSITAWYDADVVQISVGYKPMLGIEVGIAVPIK